MYRFLKRLLDIILSFTCICLFSVFMIAISLWIKLDSPGPILFRQKRVGQYKKHFSILKFRTMKTDTPKDTPTHLLEDPELYSTSSGKFLRKTSLDELPQLFNILKGEMSFVGPRPALYNQYDLISERDKYNANDIPVGLTGLAQVSGRDELPIFDKAKLDGKYALHPTLWLDFKIVVMTALQIFQSKGVVEGGTGALERKNLPDNKRGEDNK